MKSKKTFYSLFKNIITKEKFLSQSQEVERFLESQIVNLIPIFNTHTQEFSAVLYQSLLDTHGEFLENHLQDALQNIAYWHCHGRAITTLLPINQNTLLNENQLDILIEKILKSSLPIGLIRMPITGLNEGPTDLLVEVLNKLSRLGIILEFWGFNGNDKDFSWLTEQEFKGIHLSIGLLRAASMTTHTKDIFDKLIKHTTLHKIHTYSGGMSLVHDLTFARNLNVNFSYGSLLMPAVTKHQILKISESQFKHLSTNSKNQSTLGEKKLC